MKHVLPLLILLSAGLFAIKPLMNPGYFPMHDDTQVARVISMGRALREGQFPVRWVADLGYGYGYPIFNFYGPLPYYFGGILYSLGVPALSATKMMFGVGMILPAFTLYWALVGFTGWHAALVASLLYVFAPYHAVQIYVRGAVGEYWTLIFWPLVIGALFRKNTLVAGVAIAGSILSHTLMGYVTAVLLLLFGFFAFRPLLLGLGLSSFFWLPAFFEMGYTAVSGQVSESANYLDHFVCVGQLWSSPWGFGGSAPGCIDGMSFMLGKIQILLAFASVAGWFLLKPKKANSICILGIVLTFVGIVFATRYSFVFWQAIPFFSYLQYPWRFLAVTNLGLALVGGNIAELVPQSWKTISAFVLAALIVVMNTRWFHPQYIYQKNSADFETPQDLRWRASKISDEYLPPAVPRPKDETEVIFDTIARVETATSAHVVFEATQSSQVSVNKAYFPGWRYWVNDKEVRPVIRQGFPVFDIPAGQTVIDMKFTDTPIRKIANLSSLGSLIVLGVLYEKQRKAKR